MKRDREQFINNYVAKKKMGNWQRAMRGYLKIYRAMVAVHHKVLYIRRRRFLQKAIREYTIEHMKKYKNFSIATRHK